jgi:hypothetical protein
MSHTSTSLTEFAVTVCLFTYLPDHDLEGVETRRRDISDKLFIMDCAICLVKYCVKRFIFLMQVYLQYISRLKCEILEPVLLWNYNYLLTPWSRVLDKLTGLQLVKKFPAFYVTRRFLTAFASARHLSLS